MDIENILKLHKMWLDCEGSGVRAKLYGADLCGANLCGVNLSGADLCGVNLSGAKLRYADLRGADLHGANLCGAKMRCADIRGADLSGADLHGAKLFNAKLNETDMRNTNLCDVELYSANLCGAKLSGAKIENVKYNEDTAFFALQCPEEGAYIGYKKAGGMIVKLEITSDALRSSATTRKCRASKAKVLDITNIEGDKHFSFATSDYDPDFAYRVGETVCVDNFDTDRWNECSTGIHHFITRQEAVNY